MAIDPEKYGKFRNSIDSFVEEAIEEMDEVEQAPGVVTHTQDIVDNHINPVLDEFDDILSGERPPRLYIFGRAGVGKSSLINSLANKEVAGVDAVEPETAESKLYDISFPERYSDWEVVDSRGLFESIPPDGNLPDDTVELMQKDIEEYRPDVLLYVTTPGQVRGGKNDLKVLSNLETELENVPPIMTILNKVDVHISPGGDWPPENNPELSDNIQHNLEFISDVISSEILNENLSVEPFDKDNPVKGYQFNSRRFIGVVPVHLKDKPYWNVDTLSMLLGSYLPDDARLQFFQAQERAYIMRDLANDITKKCSKAAAGIGAVPLPYADAVPITALQFVQVALIGALSCRELEVKTATEYMTSVGVVTGAAVAFRKIARGLVQFIPVGGQVVSASVAGGGTYAIGKSAEKYFFDDVITEPDEFMNEGKKNFEDFNDFESNSE